MTGIPLGSIRATYPRAKESTNAVVYVPNLDGAYPVIGSWLIDGVAAGIGIRESDTPVTNNLSCFLPHLFE
jgi:glutathionylspermidine synthase